MIRKALRKLQFPNPLYFRKYSTFSLLKSAKLNTIHRQLSVLKYNQLTTPQTLRSYHPQRQLMMRQQKNGLMADPENVSSRVIKIISLHDNVKDPSSVTLRRSFKQLGLNQLDIVQIMLMCQEEFFIEFTETEGESADTVEDLVRMIATNFYTQ